MDEFQNLSFGSYGWAVRKLQAWLNELLRLQPALETSGVFDKSTEAAVRRFQVQNKLPVNYHPVIGFNTWRMIGRKLGQDRVYSDPEVTPQLKVIMAPDFIPAPGNLSIDKLGFKLLYRLRFPKAVVDKLDDDNLDRLLGFMEKDAGVSDLRWFAYMLATVLLECGGDFEPRIEGGCNDTNGCSPISQTINGVLKTNTRAYGKPRPCPNASASPPQPCPAGKNRHTYYGRGYVQLTAFGAYQKLSQRLGLGDELVHWPERAMEPATAYRIMSVGMREGAFTGRKLEHYIAGARSDYRNAREIINPGDTSTFGTGERFAKLFEEVLEASIRH